MPSKTSSPCNESSLFSNRVFAISAVSGGALGAAVFAAALRDFQTHPTGTASPCRGVSRFWFRNDAPKSWRDCMQAILADDFLSPAVLGLAFRDQLPVISGWMDDRVVVLEDAWTGAFADLVLAKEKSPGGRGLDTAFDSFVPQKDGPWRPLLVLNGTSTGSGRRILTSHVPFGDQAQPPSPAGPAQPVPGRGTPQPLFADAYEVRDLFAGRDASSGDRVRIRLSTAISNSARFPIISPPGVIRTREGAFTDRVADGGYFENFGITSANEIAQALLAKGLKPAILLITNDPISPNRIEQLDVSKSVRPLLPESTERLWFGWASAPFLALYNTRSSRGDLAVIRTGQASRDATSPEDRRVSFAHITVYGERVADPAKEQPDRFKDVSMSWWMSKPMQEYIDRQLVDGSFSGGLQQCMLRRICRWLKAPSESGDGLSARCSERLEKLFVNSAPETCAQ